MPPLRVAVIGTGAFGRNHLRVYRELEAAHPGLVQLAALVEPDPTRRQDLATLYHIPGFASVTDLLDTPSGPADNSPGGPFMPQSHRGMSAEPRTTIHAASICVPTVHHAAVAEELLLAGVDILIEKPFAATLDQADHLTAIARQRGRILAVGHLERFNPAVTATLAALNRPMFFEAHRLSVFTPRSLDVDVVLDLMIHDLDIVLSLTQSPVREVRAVGLPIVSRNTDIANVRIEFESGCIANFTASRISTEQVRKLRLFQSHQYLSLDFARQELLTISVDPRLTAALAAPTLGGPSGVPGEPSLLAGVASGVPGEPSLLAGVPSVTAPGHGWGNVNGPGGTGATTPPFPQALATATGAQPVAMPRASGGVASPAPDAHPTAGFSLRKSDVPKGEPLRLELENFLHSVRDRTPPRVSADAGRAALALALDINRHIAAHAHRAGLL
jgi:predicted dehydrogenase